MNAKSLQLCLTLCDPMDCTHQAPLSLGISRQEYWSGLPCLHPGDLSNPGSNSCHLCLLHWQVGSYILIYIYICISVQFSHSVMSSSLRPCGLQHARLPCPSPTPGACSNSCPPSWWCHPTISSSVVPFSCSQSFPAIGSFLMSQFFASGGQSIGTAASASVLPMNI